VWLYGKICDSDYDFYGSPGPSLHKRAKGESSVECIFYWVICNMVNVIVWPMIIHRANRRKKDC